MSSVSYRIVYPRGDRTLLTVTCVLDYEEDEYDFASQKSFDDRQEAAAHMHFLAKKNSLNVDPRMPKLPKLLD